jgi:hypothetical protein
MAIEPSTIVMIRFPLALQQGVAGDRLTDHAAAPNTAPTSFASSVIDLFMACPLDS